MMEAINKQGPLDHGYVAGFQDKRVGVYARSMLEAKQRAVEHFKPKKSAAHMVWVELAETAQIKIEAAKDNHVQTS
jgi:hypothetical protein